MIMILIMVVLSTQISVTLDRIASLHHQLDGQLLDTPPTDFSTVPADRRPARPLQPRMMFEQRQEAIAIYLAGASIYKTAEAMKVHRSAIVRCLSLAGVSVRTRGLDAEAMAEAARLYVAGWSLGRLEDKFGVSDSAIMTALKLHGVQTRPRNGWT